MLSFTGVHTMLSSSIPVTFAANDRVAISWQDGSGWAIGMGSVCAVTGTSLQLQVKK